MPALVERHQRTSILDRPQILGLLPTPWYWRRVDDSPAARAIILIVGTGAGFLAGHLIPHAVLGLGAAAGSSVVLLGLVERRIRAAVLARRRI